MKHELKIWPQYFCRVKDGSKTFEVRKNDRVFQAGDELVLREFDPDRIKKVTYLQEANFIYEEIKGYTGEELTFKIGYVLPIDDERVVFSLLPLKGKK